MDCVSKLEAISDPSQFILHPWQADGMRSSTKVASIWLKGKVCRRVRGVKPTNPALDLR